MTGEQANSITEAIGRELTAAVKDLNMTDKIPALAALGPAVDKMLGKLNDAVHESILGIEAMGDGAAAKIGVMGQKVQGVVKEVHDTVDTVLKSIEGGPSNGGPLSQG